jgi:hypothetical protein
MSRWLLGLALFAVMTTPLRTMAAERVQAKSPRPWQTPSFDPNSVPSQIRWLEGKIAYVTIPGPEAPVLAARGAAMRGNAQVMIVTKKNTAEIPLPLAFREMQLDRVIQGSITEQEFLAFMHKQDDEQSLLGPIMIGLLEDGTKVRIIAPSVNNGFASQVLPLTGHWAEPNGDGDVVHLWVNDCFLRLADSSDQAALWNRHATCDR